jgi:hypothetical protein
MPANLTSSFMFVSDQADEAMMEIRAGGGHRNAVVFSVGQAQESTSRTATTTISPARWQAQPP